MISAIGKLSLFDYALPGGLLIMLPLDLLAGLSRGDYPNQAAPLSFLNLLLGLYLTNSLRQPSTQAQGQTEWEESDQEGREVARANARLNRVLGAGLIFFGGFLNLFWILSILAAKSPRVANAASTDFGRLVEGAIVALFTLLMIVVAFAGTKIYLLGRRGQ